MFRTNQHDTPEPTTRATRNAVDQRQSSHPDISHPLTEGSTPDPKDAAVSEVQIPQYRRQAILAVWAAAALPMAALTWLVAPAVADRLSGEGNVPMVKALLLCITVGLIWQFVLAAARKQFPPARTVVHASRRLPMRREPLVAAPRSCCSSPSAGTHARTPSEGSDRWASKG